MTRLAARESLRSSHAGKKDFCAIFEGEMHTLYSLALLLTADHKRAEEVFLAAFNECMNGAEVFHGFERSWTRRAIVKQAIRLMKPRPGDSDIALDVCASDVPAHLLDLRPFDRFIFAITVLERYTVHEAAVFLNCMPSHVEKSRVRVLESLGQGTPLGPAVAASTHLGAIA